MSRLENPDAVSAQAEDEAYFAIVEALRQRKSSEARALANNYLLRFPSGFRRIEVLNIATRSDASAATTPAPAQ